MIGKTIESLKKGVHVHGQTIYVHTAFRGRFREEQNIELYIRDERIETHLLYAKVFHGRPPEYLPWVELFGITEQLTLGSGKTTYFDSPFEDCILKLFADNLGAGAKMFVEYYNDEETKTQLDAGVPIVMSRLGYKMLKLGFTWFKDWYFAEGHKEGNQKLQGEKPLNSDRRRKHALSIAEELALFSQINKGANDNQIHLRRAAARMIGITKLLAC